MSNSEKLAEYPQESPPSTTAIRQLPLNFASGLITGVILSCGLHPWDRALYLAMTNKRPFLYDFMNNRFVIDNFTNPYHGFTQTIISRTLGNGIYFFIQNEIKPVLYPYLRQNLQFQEWQAQLGVGMAVGSITGIATNILYAIKSQTWNHPGSTFFSSACLMWSHGGMQPFMKGIFATIYRDTTFGIFYEVLRNCNLAHHKEDHSYPFLRNASSAGIATIFSGPFNYARNIQYATHPGTTPPKVAKILDDVWQESKSSKTLASRLGFFQQKFQIGWGTARVAVGMASGQTIFEMVNQALHDNSEAGSFTPKKPL